MQLKETVYTAITECRVSLNVTATRRNGRMIIFTELQTGKNRPLPSSKNPLFQNEAKCTNFLVEMSFICVRMTNHFHIQGWALTLVLIQRQGGTRKCPMKFCRWWLISPVYLGVRTCELFFLFRNFCFSRFYIKLSSLFSLFYVTSGFNRFRLTPRMSQIRPLLLERLKW